MNSAEFEIYKAVRQAKYSPTILRQVCIICKHYLNEWDLKSKKAVCWYCRKKFFPEPKPVEKQPEGKLPKWVPQPDGSHAIIIDGPPKDPKGW